MFARGYSVFHAAQVDGYAAPALPVLSEAKRIGHAKAFFAAPALRCGMAMPAPTWRCSGASAKPCPYVAFWLKVLRGDKRATFTAAAKAQQAADWMHARELADVERAEAA